MGEYYNEMLNDGQKYEKFISDIFMHRYGIQIKMYDGIKDQLKYGENLQGIEIKYQKPFSRTRNLWIETSERTRTDRPYFQSGIYRVDNTWIIATGDYSKVFLFSKKQLKEWHTRGHFTKIENNMRTSIGFLLNERMASKICILEIECGGEA